MTQYATGSSTLTLQSSGFGAYTAVQSASAASTITFSFNGVASKVGLSVSATSSLTFSATASATKRKTAVGESTFWLAASAGAASLRIASASSKLLVRDYISARHAGRPDIGSGPTWAINLDSKEKSSTRYAHYEFNSFFQLDGETYGVANDGIYLLTGSSDDGTDIDAGVSFIRSDLGIGGAKHVPSVYIGAASDGKLVLRADVDGVARTYQTRTATPYVAQHRIDVGKGVRGSYWQFELANANGDDFVLSDLTVLPIALSRRT